jgi:hypothetical protein
VSLTVCGCEGKRGWVGCVCSQECGGGAQQGGALLPSCHRHVTGCFNPHTTAPWMYWQGHQLSPEHACCAPTLLLQSIQHCCRGRKQPASVTCTTDPSLDPLPSRSPSPLPCSPSPLPLPCSPSPLPPSLPTPPPEFSFFNHSCVPNCINWVLPGEPRAMVVRAARHIPAGAFV